MFTKYLENKSIFIVPEEIKEIILLSIFKQAKLYDISFKTMEECKQNLYYQYDEKAIVYLCKKHNIKPQIAKTYLDNLKYDDLIKNTSLEKIKKDLIEKNLIFKNENFFKEFENKKVYIIGYYDLDYDTKKALSHLKNYEFIKNEITNNKIPMYAFNSLNDEAEYLAYEIAKLLDNNVDINKIKIVNYNDKYYPAIRRIFDYYKIPIQIEENTKLMSLPLTQYFLNLLENYSLNDALENLKEKYDLNNEKNALVYQKLIDIINKFSWYEHDFLDIKDIFIFMLEKETIKFNKMTNCVSFSSLEIEANLDNHVFLINCLQGECPVFKKDDDFFSDASKEKYGLDTSASLNSIKKTNYIDLLKRIKNLNISYSKFIGKEKTYPANIIDSLNIDGPKDYKINLGISYSDKLNLLKYASKIDDLCKYNHKSLEINDFYSNYVRINYKNYDNTYHKIDASTINKKLNLSYSKIDNYFNCNFMYYLKHVLKLEDKEQTFSILLGNLYHYVLSKIYDDNFDFEASYNEFLENENLTNKDEILLINAKEILKAEIDILLSQYNKTKFKDVIAEKAINVRLNDVNFNGRIDKVMLNKKDNQAIIIDYKTGNDDGKNLNFANYGLNLQLPIYLYLASKDEKLKNFDIVGFYLQKVYDPELSIKEKVNQTDLKLDGYTLRNEDIIGKIDTHYVNGSYIKGVRINKDGSLAKKDTYYEDLEFIKKHSTLAKEKILEAADNIKKANFAINPKKYGSNFACTYCPFKEICFAKYKDEVHLLKEVEVNEDDD